MSLALAFLLAFMISLVATPAVREWAIRRGHVDEPVDKRKVHAKPIPRVGGIAIAAAFTIAFLANFEINRAFLGLLSGMTILFMVGVVDDIRGLGPWHKLLWQVMASIAVLAGGIGIIQVTDPFGGIIVLDTWRIPVEVGILEFNILPIANLVSVIWIVGMINVINFLDGLDGLAAGVSSIAALVLFLMAVAPVTGNATVALAALILLGALLGFLPYNFYPARIFMGDSGAYVVGMLLALLSIYAESKVAVGALVLGFAILDAAWVVLRRLWRRQSPFKPDRGHLHHVIFDSGIFSHRQTVLVFYVLATVVAAGVLMVNAVFAFGLMVVLLATVMILVKMTAVRRNGSTTQSPPPKP